MPYDAELNFRLYDYGAAILVFSDQYYGQVTSLLYL